MSKELLGAASAVALSRAPPPPRTPAPARPPPRPPPRYADGRATPAATAGEAVRAADMIGRPVQGSDGKPLGKVKDAVVDAQSGRSRSS